MRANTFEISGAVIPDSTATQRCIAWLCLLRSISALALAALKFSYLFLLTANVIHLNTVNIDTIDGFSVILPGIGLEFFAEAFNYPIRVFIEKSSK